MRSSSIPDGIPVLSRGRHWTPRRGACFMEYASVLAGERWSDHPKCTHPLLAELARQVNDRISDAERQRLTRLVPSVVGLRGTDRTCLTLAVTVASSVILEVPESSQRVLAAGLLRAEQLCAEGGFDLAELRCQARSALDLVPGAVAWVEKLQPLGRLDAETFAARCAPTMVRCAVEGVVASGSPHRDELLRALLDDGIAACPKPERISPANEFVNA
jgi:hypothetical protein